jgi:hypothetical protein
MPDLESILSGFDPISLKEMDHVQLLDRVDTKYIINIGQMEELLSEIREQYSALSIEGVMIHPYETLYFDTPEFNLYLMHHNGKRNRYKLRCRRYVNSGIAYFEIKSKTNTCRTIKKRVRIESIPDELDETLNQYIGSHIPRHFENYVPSLRVYFERLTLVSKSASERLTFDTHLRYSANGIDKSIENLVIVEVKQEKDSVSLFRELMKQKGLPMNYLSKYCMGVICLNKEVKKNNFKRKISELNKLGYDLH